MMDNADKNSDANVVEVEANQADAPTDDAASMQRTPEEPPKGGGFVWLLAVMLIIAGGGYAVWPYVAPKIDPVIKEARTILGLEARPTQPSLPSSARSEQVQPTRPAMPMDEVAQAPAAAPTVEPQAEITPEPDVQPAPETAMPQAEPQFAPQFQPQPTYPPETVPEVPGMQASPVPEQPAPRPAVSPDVAPMVQSLTDRLNILEARLLSATRDGGGQSGQGASESAINLVRTLSELKADLETLQTRVAVLESKPSAQIDPSASAQALVLSVTQLGTATENNRPFAAELDALARIGGAEPVIAEAVQRLSAFAGVGVPTQATLDAEFKAMAVAVMKAHGQTQRRGWWDEVTGAASSLVTVRQTDPARIDDPVERALAVAELALRDNDLKTSVAALDALQGAEGEAARTWRDKARARVEVREAMDVLHNHALAALAATGGA